MIPFIEALRRQAPQISLAILPPIIGGLSVKLMRGEVDHDD
jgi:hypothetical protein